MGTRGNCSLGSIGARDECFEMRAASAGNQCVTVVVRRFSMAVEWGKGSVTNVAELLKKFSFLFFRSGNHYSMSPNTLGGDGVERSQGCRRQ